MCMLSRRLQILLDERQYGRLAAFAHERGLSVGAAVREAIELAIPATTSERSAAARRILDAEPMPVPDPAELREELEAERGRRG